MIDLGICGDMALVLTTDLVLGWAVKSNPQGVYIFTNLLGTDLRYLSASQLTLSL